ncbi:hypothetical protein C0Q70_15789 [Pomacea canaliculata]|uniref:CUB domain-containing protein n=2 Tax=Pomacea canaliculata TaxID=400727 RepID=A0A2T7NVU6_POMCA|nr:hypothetical protein C0Q70_15789 [Pomacea canaliculata]
MTSFCSRSVRVNDSLLLDLTEELSPDRMSVGHLSCVVTVESQLGVRLSVHVLQLAISDKLDTPDRLHIYSLSPSGVETRITPSTGLYGVLERPFLIYNTAGVIVPDFRSAGSRMRLDYQGKPTVIYRGFRLLITAFHEPDGLGGCEEGNMLCPYAAMCISTRVRCDALPNCGQNDFEDERSCEKEDIVTNLLEEYSLRTALIAGVTGSLVFLLCALLVGFVLFKLNRHRYGCRNRAVQYTASTEDTCIFQNEADLTGLRRPPTYETIVTPPTNLSDPPPAYSSIAAAVHVHRGLDCSEEESVKLVARGPQFQQQAPHVLFTRKHQSTPMQGELRETGNHRADSDDEVRMHGTWPSDTDEEEEVKARRKRKGGKSKNKSGAKCPVVSQRKGNGRRKTDSTKAEDIVVRSHVTATGSLSARHGCRSAAADYVPRGECQCACPSCGSDSTSASERQGEITSETESQCAGQDDNSRTESHSRSVSPASVHSTSGPLKNAENVGYNQNRPDFVEMSKNNDEMV